MMKNIKNRLTKLEKQNEYLTGVMFIVFNKEHKYFKCNDKIYKDDENIEANILKDSEPVTEHGYNIAISCNENGDDFSF